jgi:hypothetical protein
VNRPRAFDAAAFVIVFVAVSMVGVGGAREASAVTLGSGELGGGTLGVGIESSHGAQPIQVDAGSTSLPPLVHYRATPLAGGRAGDLEGLCNARGQAVVDGSEVVFGWLYDVVGYTSDGRVVSDTHECVPFPDPGDHTVLPPPPALPAPPTVGDVWRAVALPRPVVGVNPVSRGVTGLDSWLWSGGAQTVQIAATLGGYRITGVARLVEYRFSTDEGYLGASTSPGTASSPAATHRFVTKGAHSLSVASVWRATATMIGPGAVTPVPIDINVAVLTATVGYPVVEVRSRLVA